MNTMYKEKLLQTLELHKIWIEIVCHSQSLIQRLEMNENVFLTTKCMRSIFPMRKFGKRSLFFVRRYIFMRWEGNCRVFHGITSNLLYCIQNFRNERGKLIFYQLIFFTIFIWTFSLREHCIVLRRIYNTFVTVYRFYLKYSYWRRKYKSPELFILVFLIFPIFLHLVQFLMIFSVCVIVGVC